MALMLHVGPVTLVALIALVGLGALMALVAPVALVALMGITRFKPVQFTRSNLLHLNISFHIFRRISWLLGVLVIEEGKVESHLSLKCQFPASHFKIYIDTS